MLKKILLGLVGLIVVVAIGAASYIVPKFSAFDESMAKVYDVKPADITVPDLSSVAFDKYKPAPETPKPVTSGEDDAPADDAKADDAKADETAHADEANPAADEQKKLRATWERGQHLANSIGACFACHGADLATPDVVDMGPVGKIVPPNISMGGLLKDYNDGELHRLIVHGLKKDGTSAIFMPSQDFNWWPDEDVGALIGFLRTVPGVEKKTEPTTVGPLGKFLDRTGKLNLDVARRIDHQNRLLAPTPAESVTYGSFVAKLCMGCHGAGLAGGPIPGAPPDLPVPVNITLHETGIAKYDFAKFDTLMRTAKKPDGSDLDPFMPVSSFKHFNDVEMKALWMYLESIPKKPFGER
jgi:cytochrome c553